MVEIVIDKIVLPSRLRTELTNRFAFYEKVEKNFPDKKTWYCTVTDKRETSDGKRGVVTMHVEIFK